MTQFWMIVRDPGLAKYTDPPHPRKVYTSLIEAEHDVESLARQEGKRFYLLGAIAYAEPASPPIKWTPTVAIENTTLAVTKGGRPMPTRPARKRRTAGQPPDEGDGY